MKHTTTLLISLALAACAPLPPELSKTESGTPIINQAPSDPRWEGLSMGVAYENGSVVFQWQDARGDALHWRFTKPLSPSSGLSPSLSYLTPGGWVAWSGSDSPGLGAFPEDFQGIAREVRLAMARAWGP